MAGLPRIAGLSGADVARVAMIAMHSPVAGEQDTLTWRVTLLSAQAEPLAESLASSPDYPAPLSEIAQPHLDVVGLAQVGRWRAEPTVDGTPRFSAMVEQGPRGV